MNILTIILVAQLFGPNIIPSDFLKDEVEDPKASLLNFSEHVPGFFVFPYRKYLQLELSLHRRWQALAEDNSL